MYTYMQQTGSAMVKQKNSQQKNMATHSPPFLYYCSFTERWAFENSTCSHVTPTPVYHHSNRRTNPLDRPTDTQYLWLLHLLHSSAVSYSKPFTLHFYMGWKSLSSFWDFSFIFNSVCYIWMKSLISFCSVSQVTTACNSAQLATRSRRHTLSKLEDYQTISVLQDTRCSQSVVVKCGIGTLHHPMTTSCSPIYNTVYSRPYNALQFESVEYNVKYCVWKPDSFNRFNKPMKKINHQSNCSKLY